MSYQLVSDVTVAKYRYILLRDTYLGVNLKEANPATFDICKGNLVVLTTDGPYLSAYYLGMYKDASLQTAVTLRTLINKITIIEHSLGVCSGAGASPLVRFPVIGDQDFVEFFAPPNSVMKLHEGNTGVFLS